MGNPLVSIITPSLNQAEFIENTILSVINQDYKNIEYIIMDGGSTDGSQEIISKYERFIKFWESKPDKGQADAINKGFSKAEGQIFAFLNSDDFYLEGAVSKIIEYYHEYPNAIAWVGGCREIAKDGFVINTILPPPVISKKILANWKKNWFYQPSCFFSANVARKVNFFDNNFYNAFDFDFWMKILDHGEFISFKDILSVATIHAQAKTQKASLNMFSEVKYIIRKNGFGDKVSPFVEKVKESKNPPLLNKAFQMYIKNKNRDGKNNLFIDFPKDKIDRN